MPAEAGAGRSLELSHAACAQLLPARDAASHKGSHGTLFCLCGSAEYVGAALLAASAAGRAGAGLVALAVPGSLQALFAGRVLEAITLSLPEDAGDVEAAGALELLESRRATAFLLGCGLRESEGNRQLVLRLLERHRLDPDAAALEQPPPAVLDGGALNLLARSGEWWQGVRCECVLTPHPGEFARLTGAAVGPDDGERLERAVQAAQEFGQVVVLKGARSVIAAPTGWSAVSPFANPALATAGTGDVLAGMIGALLAQGLEPFAAACLGVYLHGLAAERLRRRLGDAGLLASDLPPEIPLARRELGEQRLG